MKRVIALLTTITILFSGCASSKNEEKEDIEFTSTIFLSDENITVDNKPIERSEGADVYAANDIIYYKSNQGFTYGSGRPEDEHSQDEANKHTVVHITKAGTYSIKGKLSYGQIAVDLGNDAKNDPSAVVNLYLDGIDINCDVAPAIIFYNVFECGDDDPEKATYTINTKNAGANIIISDDSENRIQGSSVARIYKTYELSDDGKEVISNKKLHKYDGTLHSKMSLNIKGGSKGNGILNIVAENEGIATEMHLSIYSGIININSMDDGINANEDNVSVISVYKPTNLNIVVNGYYNGEGDGIDSNGWIVIDADKINIETNAPIIDDVALDAHFGVYYFNKNFTLE